ncbi:MAG: autotransporter domain-containing protein [Pseudomonadota bacterium]
MTNHTLRHRHATLPAAWLSMAGAIAVVVAAMVAFAPAARADCGLSNGQFICDGDLSGGITNVGAMPDIPALVTEFSVLDLTENIAPMAAGTHGIEFVTDLDGRFIIINVTTHGGFEINTEDSGGDGIFVASSGDSVDAFILLNDSSVVTNGQQPLTSRIVSGRHGIDAQNSGGDLNVFLFSGSSIVAAEDGVRAQESGADDLTIAADGTIEATNGAGIRALESATGNLVITGDGTIEATNGAGIHAEETGDGNLQISVNGTIAATNGVTFEDAGISAEEDGDGDLTIDVGPSGSITTTGASTHGIYAFQSGTDELTINVSGNISASGVDALGIAAVVVDPGATATVNLLAGSSVRGGTGTGTGVTLGSNPGAPVTLNNVGTISALSGIAIVGQVGDDTVNNFSGGVIIGAVNLRGGDDTVHLDTASTFDGATFDGGDDNDALRVSGTVSATLDGGQHTNFETFEKTDGGALLLTGTHNFATSATVSGGTLTLSNGAALNVPTVTNNAELAVGATTGEIGTATITGTFEQGAAATYIVDVDLTTGTADRIDVTGAATVAGGVAVTLQTFSPNLQVIPILTADGGITDAGLAISSFTAAGSSGLTPTGSQVVDIRLVFPDANTVALSVQADFADPLGGPLNRNQTNLGAAFNDVLAQGLTGAPLEPLLVALITGPTTIDQYRDALDVLLPEVYLNTETAMLFSSRDFLGDLLACPTADDGGAVASDGQCLWVRPKGRKFDRDATFENIGYEDTVGGMAAGAQFRFAPGWFASVGASYEAGTLKADSAARSESDRYHVGTAITYETGAWRFVGAVAGGIGNFDTSRRIAFTGFDDGTATSEHDVRYVTGQLRAAYTFAMPGWYMRPRADLTVTYLDREGVTESGAGTANLAVDGGEETIFAVTPGVEIGGTYELVPGTRLKPFLIAGVTFFSDDEHSLTSAFALAPDVSFETTTEHGDVFGNIHAGATLAGDTSNFNLTLGYKGAFSDDVTQHGVYARGTWAF